MVFSSHLFVFYFLPLSLGLYFALPRRARHLPTRDAGARRAEPAPLRPGAYETYGY